MHKMYIITESYIKLSSEQVWIVAYTAYLYKSYNDTAAP